MSGSTPDHRCASGSRRGAPAIMASAASYGAVRVARSDPAANRPTRQRPGSDAICIGGCRSTTPRRVVRQPTARASGNLHATRTATRTVALSAPHEGEARWRARMWRCGSAATVKRRTTLRMTRTTRLGLMRTKRLSPRRTRNPRALPLSVPRASGRGSGLPSSKHMRGVKTRMDASAPAIVTRWWSQSTCNFTRRARLASGGALGWRGRGGHGPYARALQAFSVEHVIVSVACSAHHTVSLAQHARASAQTTSHRERAADPG